MLTRGETAAAIMAATYGELTGRPGACVVTRGPGAASAVNGVAQALLDRAPMLIVSDAVRSGEAARVSHQRLDQQALFKPVTKWSVSVGPDGAHEAVAAAIEVACRAPAGPVHVDVDVDAGLELPMPPPAPTRDGDEARARQLVAEARAPVVAIGVGARRAASAVRRALDGVACPILTTYKAKGMVSESSPSAAGFLTGATIEAQTLRYADLIIGVGLDPVELIPAAWPYEAPLLSLTEWVADSSYFDPAVEIIGPLEDSLELIQPLLLLLGREGPAGVSGFRAMQRALDVAGDGLLPQDVVRAVRHASPPGATATIDSGAHMFAAMAFWTVDAPGEALISSGLATMGFALPAAIATAHTYPERRVVCLTGDGGLGMTLAELETAARYSLPVVVVVLNDAALSLIEIKQRSGQGGRNAVGHSDVDFSEVARGLGLRARRVETLVELEAALAEAFAQGEPFLIDAVVDAGNYAAVLAAIRGGAR